MRKRHARTSGYGLAKDYHGHKKTSGPCPGGWHCPHCAPDISTIKKLYRRIIRRTTKIKTTQEAKDAETCSP